MRIALTGPMYSGKSTVAKILEGVYDYTYVNFTRQLKEIAVRALTATHLAPYVDGLTVEIMEKEKAKYRAFLQEFGTVIGYDDNPAYITSLIGDEENIVFDNVRYDGQWETLESLGFRLVRLDLDTGDIIRRAEHMGVSTYRIRDQLNHVSENSLNYSPYITYDASRSSAETIARLIVEDKPQPAPKRQHRGNYEDEVTQGHRYTRLTETPRPDRIRGTNLDSVTFEEARTHEPRRLQGLSASRIAVDESTMMQGPDGEVPVMVTPPRMDAPLLGHVDEVLAVPTPTTRRYLTPSSFSAANTDGYSTWFNRETTPGNYTVHTNYGTYTIRTEMNENGDLVAIPMPQEVERSAEDNGIF